MDVSFTPDDDPATPITWNDLAWTCFPDGAGLRRYDRAAAVVHPRRAPVRALAQWGTDSARMASILFQKPVMIAVHAKEMLEGLA